jgi:hypothetical protein
VRGAGALRKGRRLGGSIGADPEAAPVPLLARSACASEKGSGHPGLLRSLTVQLPGSGATSLTLRCAGGRVYGPYRWQGASGCLLWFSASAAASPTLSAGKGDVVFEPGGSLLSAIQPSVRSSSRALSLDRRRVMICCGWACTRCQSAEFSPAHSTPSSGRPMTVVSGPDAARRSCSARAGRHATPRDEVLASPARPD